MLLVGKNRNEKVTTSENYLFFYFPKCENDYKNDSKLNIFYLQFIIDMSDSSDNSQPKKNGTSFSDRYPPSPTNRTPFAYGMAILILGTALGYMFLGGRIMSVANLKMPRADFVKKTSEQASGYAKAGATSGSSSSSGSSAGSARSSSSYSQANQQSSSQSDPYTKLMNDLILLRTAHMRNLGLSQNDFNEKAIKNAYRELVMKYHPDRLASNDPNKAAYNKKFQSVNHSYKVLLNEINELNDSSTSKRRNA
jgi:hypothetical protein